MTLPDSFSVDEFARRNRIGLTTAYAEIRAGRLVARKIGRRTVVLAEDARLWRDNLPKVQPENALTSGDGLLDQQHQTETR
jgi:hypothetical protein